MPNVPTQILSFNLFVSHRRLHCIAEPAIALVCWDNSSSQHEQTHDRGCHFSEGVADEYLPYQELLPSPQSYCAFNMSAGGGGAWLLIGVG